MAMAMRATSVKAAATWAGEPADSVVLDYDERHRRRVSMRGKKGLPFVLDLPQAAELHGGDALVLEDGRLIEVVAASEPLLEIRCADALQTARVAWHLGNRHIATQLRGTALRIRRDHVIAEMAQQLGAEAIAIEAPFDPEGGAYAHPHRGHGHGG
jgi:urease accessory protein